MRKYTLFLLIFAFIFSFININSVSAYDLGCMTGDAFSRTTGQPCGEITNSECRVGDLFSSVTGRPCGVGTWCHTFNTNLGIGSSGDEVNSLLDVLVKEGVAFPRSSNFSATFDGSLASFVSAFQEKYRSEILTPAGLSSPTGYVGVRTRAKINTLYRCLKPSVVISGVNGPQLLDVNQQGTWTVTAYDSSGGNLAYSVSWGDEVYAIPMASLEKSSTAQQSATFTHSYAQAGMYTPTFTVTSANTINCITFPCPSNGGSAQASLSVNVSGATTSAGSLYISPSSISLGAGGSGSVQAYYQPPFSCPTTNPASACAQVMPAPVEVTAYATWSVGNENIARLVYSSPGSGCYPYPNTTNCGNYMGVAVFRVSAGTTTLTAMYRDSSQNMLKASALVTVN